MYQHHHDQFKVDVITVVNVGFRFLWHLSAHCFCFSGLQLSCFGSLSPFSPGRFKVVISKISILLCLAAPTVVNVLADGCFPY